MNRRRTGKVMKAHLHKPSIGIPHPSCLHGIDKQGNHSGINAIGSKFRPLRHGSRNNSRRRRTEHQIENKAGRISLNKAVKIRKNI